MKKILSIVLLMLCFATITYAREVVTFKDGSVVKGKISEFVPGGNISIITEDGNTLVFSTMDIVKIDTDRENGDGEYLLLSSYYDMYPKKNLAKKGYRGFATVDPVALTSYGYSLGLYTTHGYQFDHNIFLGGGIGILYTWRDSGLAIPIYLECKNNVGRGFFQFTWGGRLGYAIINDDYKDRYIASSRSIDGSIYLNGYVGCRIPISEQFAINITPQVEVYIGEPINLNLGVGLGFEF
ncbi:MAG: hypothetical protein IKY75_06125 [Bacteroidaceae bacterium]|nr:hypothetical protein [Bacteroidaceae bacterium]